MARPASGALLLSLLALAFGAHAGAAAADSVPATKAVRVHGHAVTLDQHADDPRFGLTAAQVRTTFGRAPSGDGALADAARAAAQTADAAPGVASASAAVAPNSTGCATERTTDDSADARSALPRYKAIYAYPRDQANRYATYKDLIQRSAGWVTDKVAESGGRGPRWDYGTSCGPGSLDILTVQLPRTAAEYLASQSGRINLMTADLDALRAQWNLASGKWNFVVWADWTGRSGWASAQGQHYLDDTASAGNWNNSGGLYALLYGAGNVDFLGTGSLGYAAYAVTHEVGHTLGSVSDNAPHSTLAGHCTDGYSIMCYSDGGPQAALYSATACPSGGGPAGYDGVAFDCGGDDYLSPSPAAGSWLSGHWNLFNSSFMCEAATCLGATAAAPPVAALSATPATVATGAAVTLDAGASRAAPEAGALTYDLDAGDGSPVVGGATTPTLDVHYARAGSYTARVVVHDGDGGSAAATTAVTVTNRLPSVALALTPAAAVAGRPVTATATASDPEGTALSVAFDRDGDGTYETATGSGLSTTVTAPAGRRTLGVRVTDADGGSATAQATLSVTAPAPSPPTDAATGDPATGAAPGPPAAPAIDAAPITAPTDGVPPAAGAPPTGRTAAPAGRPSILRARLHSGRLVVRLRCAAGGAGACRLRLAMIAGPRRLTRTLTVPAGATREVTLLAGRSRSARLSVRDLVSGRALPARTVLAR